MAMSQHGKTILWDPLGSERFVVGGSNEVRMYEWKAGGRTKHSTGGAGSGSGTGSVKSLAVCSDLTNMKSLAWSPNPSYPDLLAIGLTSNRTILLLRMSELLSPSLTPTVMQPTPSSSLTPQLAGSFPYLPLPVRLSRPCNALAFNPAEPNVLAAGLDKLRDYGLQIWDVETQGRILDLKLRAGRGGEDEEEGKLDAFENFNNRTNYFPLGSSPSRPTFRRSSMSPGATLAAIANVSSPLADPKPVLQYGSSEAVSSLAFLNPFSSSSPQLVAGMGGKWLRTYDLRQSTFVGTGGESGTTFQNPNFSSNPASATPTAVYTTKSVSSIVSDPFNPHQFASLGEDGLVRLWDVRKSGDSILVFGESHAGGGGWSKALPPANHRGGGGGIRKGGYLSGTGGSSGTGHIVQVAFSPFRRGALATLEKDSLCVRVWDLLEGESRSSDGKRRPDGLGATNHAPFGARGVGVSEGGERQGGFTSGLGLGFAGEEMRSVQEQEYIPEVILADDRKAKPFTRPPVSFTFAVPPPASPSSPLSHNLVSVSREGQIEIVQLRPPGQTAWSSLGALAAWTGSVRVDDLPVTGTEIASSGQVLGGENATKEQDEREREGKIKKVGKVAVTIVGTSAPVSSGPARSGTEVEGHKKTTNGADTAVDHSVSRDERGRLRDPLPAQTSSSQRVFQSRSNSRARRPAVPAEGAAGTGIQNDAGDGDSKRRSTLHGHISAKLEELKRSEGEHGMRSHRKYEDADEDEEEKSTLERDISVKMKDRASKGYSLNASHNFKMTEDSLQAFWQWINHADSFAHRTSAIVDEYDFSFRGVLSIMTGFAPAHSVQKNQMPPNQPSGHLSTYASVTSASPPSLSAAIYDDFKRSLKRPPFMNSKTAGYSSAAAELVSRHSVTSFTKYRGVKEAQRKLGLAMCGRYYASGDVDGVVSRYEKEGNLEAAAAWAFFCGHTERACEVLMSSKDDSLRLLASSLAGYLAQKESSNANSKQAIMFRELCQSLSTNIGRPIYRAMFAYIANDDWADVVAEEGLPLKDRVAVALRFLDDDQLIRWLQETTESRVKQGDPEAILLTGLCATDLSPASGLDLIQAYVNKTHDLQTAALAVSYFPMGQEFRSRRWIESYRSLLDSWRAFGARARFDVERGRRLRDFASKHESSIGENRRWTDQIAKMAEPQILIRCHYCNEVVSPRKPNANKAVRGATDGKRSQVGSATKLKTTFCPSCKKSLPRCSICLLALSVSEPKHLAATKDPESAWCWCQRCRHGGHATHVLEWFRRGNPTCPVADCDCRCREVG